MYYSFSKFPLHEVNRRNYAESEASLEIDSWDEDKRLKYDSMPLNVRVDIQKRIRSAYRDKWDILNPDSYKLTERLYNAYQAPYMNGPYAADAVLIAETEDYNGNWAAVRGRKSNENLEFNFVVGGMNTHFYMSKKVFHAVMKRISELDSHPVTVKHRGVSYTTDFGGVAKLTLYVTVDVVLGKVVFSYHRPYPNMSEGEVSFVMSFGELQRIQRKLKGK